MRKSEKVLKETTDRCTYHIYRCVDQDPYPEEYGEYQKHKRGYRGCKKTKVLWQHQVRMYRTWKRHRKNQWK